MLIAISKLSLHAANKDSAVCFELPVMATNSSTFCSVLMPFLWISYDFSIAIQFDKKKLANSSKISKSQQ